MKMKSLLILTCLLAAPAFAMKPTLTPEVFTENMTWQEIQQRIHTGSTIAIIPTGGTEQNGPQLAEGKHNVIIHYTAGQIATKLGNALVVPVMAYVPEGNITPPEGHMQFAGTLSLSNQHFAALLEDTARSLKQHGFTLICFIGDHGASQPVQAQVAAKLSEEWKNAGVKVIQVSDYYANNGQENWVKAQHLDVGDPDGHGGFLDTSELMALDATGVRTDKLGKRSADDYQTTGSNGDSTLASAAYGRQLLAMKIDAAIKQIHAAQP